MNKIILASNSPRRREILSRTGFSFDIAVSNSDEEKSKSFDEEVIKKNSLNKVSAVAKQLNGAFCIIGADTMVILDSVCLFKPLNFYEALFMLKKLSGKTHAVVTSHTILNTNTGKVLTETSTSYVTFKKLSLFEIIHYLISKKPFDKAGSYGIQDFLTPENYKNPPKKSFIKKLEGSYYNVVGLDIDLIKTMLDKIYCV